MRGEAPHGGRHPRLDLSLDDEDLLRGMAEKWERSQRDAGKPQAPFQPINVQLALQPPAEDEEPLPEQLTALHVARLWVSRRKATIPPSEETIRAQQRPAAWIAQQPGEHVLRAMWGIEQVYPHAPPKSEPWDLHDLKRLWDKALQASENHPSLREMRLRVSLEQSVKRRTEERG